MSIRIVIVFVLCICIHTCSGFVKKLRGRIHRNLQTIDEYSDIIIDMAHCSRRALREVESELSKAVHHHEKASIVQEHLTKHAKISQTPVHRKLAEFAAEHSGDVSQYWITNQIVVRGATRRLIAELSTMSEIGMIQADVQMNEGSSGASQEPKGTESAEVPTPWYFSTLGANQGSSYGEGAIGGFIDSGIMASHQEFNGKSILAWKDVVQGKSAPYDDLYHGTHVTATSVGNNVGLAPKASIVACKAFDHTGMLSSKVIECAQFMICPNGNCKLTPHVINNSWSFFQSNDAEFERVTHSWQQAGIIAVACTGNNFQAQTCADLTQKPPSTFDNVIGVGSTDQNDALSDFSRQGYGAESRPDIAAPGRDIPSASITGNNAYVTRTGTSMAAAVFTGMALALVGEAKKNNVVLTQEMLINIIRESSVRASLPDPNFSCNYVQQFPNPAYGVGRLDFARSISALHALT